MSAFFDHIAIKQENDKIITFAATIKSSVESLAEVYSRSNPGFLLNKSGNAGATYTQGVYSYDYSSTIAAGSDLASVGTALGAISDKLNVILENLKAVVETKISNYSELDYQYAEQFMNIEDLLNSIDTSNEGGV